MSEEQPHGFSKLMTQLKQERDELKLKVHLGGQDLKDEWSELEDKFLSLQDRFRPLRDSTEEVAEDVWDSLKLVGGEVREGFHRIRKSL